MKIIMTMFISAQTKTNRDTHTHTKKRILLSFALNAAGFIRSSSNTDILNPVTLDFICSITLAHLS